MKIMSVPDGNLTGTKIGDCDMGSVGCHIQAGEHQLLHQ